MLVVILDAAAIKVLLSSRLLFRKSSPVTCAYHQSQSDLLNLSSQGGIWILSRISITHENTEAKNLHRDKYLIKKRHSALENQYNLANANQLKCKICKKTPEVYFLPIFLSWIAGGRVGVGGERNESLHYISSKPLYEGSMGEKFKTRKKSENLVTPKAFLSFPSC